VSAPVQEYRERVVARPEDSAERWGNEGLRVLSTPAIVGHMETVCVRMLAAQLGPGQMTVGTAVEIRHLAPVLVGDPVDIAVRPVESGRRMTIEFTVTDRNGQLVATGSHRRSIVDTAAFMARLDGPARKGS
jgi:fluoroacetyl-CoA thioesterase